MAKRTPITWDDVESIRAEAAGGATSADLARRYGVRPRTIRDIVARRSWRGTKAHPVTGRGLPPANRTVAPATDKVWAEKSRKARQKPPSNLGLSLDKYNAGYKAYVEDQTYTHVAQALGVDHRTAKKLVEEGYPHKGWRPYRERFARATAAAHEKEDYTLTQMRAEVLTVSRALFTKLAARIRALVPEELAADRIPAHLQKAFETMRAALGEPDQTVRHQVDDPFRDWSVEEMVRYIQTGQAPARDRAPGIGPAAPGGGETEKDR